MNRRNFLRGSVAVLGAVAGLGLAEKPMFNMEGSVTGRHKTVQLGKPGGIKKGEVLFYGGGRGGGKSYMTMRKINPEHYHLFGVTS